MLSLQYVLPTDSPHLAKSMLKMAISPVLWAQHKPDRFDMWSAGGRGGGTPGHVWRRWRR